MEDLGQKTAYLLGHSGIYAGEKYALQVDEFSIGRSPQNNLVMTETTISAAHAKIVKTDSGYEIHDLKSTNGTFINGTKIAKQALRTNDWIKLDVIEFTFFNPVDVARTEFPRPDQKTGEKKTVLRPPEPAGKGPLSTTPTGAPQATQPLWEPKAGGGRTIIGLMVGLIVAITFSLGGLLASALIQTQSTAPNLVNLLRNQISLFPILHLHTTWIYMPQWNTAAILAIVCLPLGPILAGAIAQNIGRAPRPKTAFYFSIFYVLLTLAAQLWILNFDWSTWQNLTTGSGLGIYHPVLNLVAVTAYFWAVSLILSFIGTLLGRR